jgi:hypothetical protein
MPQPRKADWGKYKEVARAMTKSWNALVDLPKVFSEEYPWLKEYTFGFFVDDDVSERMTYAFKFLEMAHFDYDDIDAFNSAVGTRYGLNTDAAGHLKWHDNFIMIRPKELTDEIVAERNRVSEERMQRAVENKTHAIEGDPKEKEAREYSREHTSLEEMDVNRETGQVKKRGPGRPPKNKE